MPLNKQKNSNVKRQINFANFSRRIQAATLDGMILFILFLSLTFLIAQTELNPYSKVSLFLLPMLMLEPILVSFTGASIGHHLKMLRVENNQTGKNLNLISAFIRFISKTLLGWFSLLFIFTTKRHQALHDKISGSVVVMNKAAKAKGIMGTPERIIKETEFHYPSSLRRIITIIFYIFAIIVFLSLLSGLFTSEECLFHDRCSAIDLMVMNILGLIMFVMLAFVIVQGWRARLWGCKRSKLEG